MQSKKTLKDLSNWAFPVIFAVICLSAHVIKQAD